MGTPEESHINNLQYIKTDNWKIAAVQHFNRYYVSIFGSLIAYWVLSRRQVLRVVVQVVLQMLKVQPFPLYIAVLMKDVVTWRSSYIVNVDDLPDTTEAAFNALLDSLETHLGITFVSHTLAYITVALNGLSEVRFEEETLSEA